MRCIGRLEAEHPSVVYGEDAERYDFDELVREASYAEVALPDAGGRHASRLYEKDSGRE